MPKTLVSKEQLAGLESLQRLRGAEKHPDIVRLASELIAGWPDFFPFYVMRGMSRMDLREYEAALPDFQRALELNAGEANSVEGLGICFHKLGQIDDAVRHLTKSFYANPTFKTASLLIRAAFDAAEIDRNLTDVVFRNGYEYFFRPHPSHEVVLARYLPIEDWCAANSIALEEFDPGGEIRLTSAQGTPITPYNAPPMRFATIPNARGVAGLDWVIAPTGDVLNFADLSLSGYADYKFGWWLQVPFCVDGPRNRVLYGRSANEVHIDEDAIFLSAPLQNHFGDWMFEYLPRLAARELPGKRALKVFTTADLPKQHRETLARFVPPEDLIEGEAGTAYRFRSLTLPIGIFSTKLVPKSATFIYRALAAKQEPMAPGVAGRSYYLERSQNLRGRNIVNVDEFKSVLAEFNVETVRRPELSKDEQDALFSEAGLIITPFGSDYITWYQLRPGSDIVLLEFEDMNKVYQLGQAQIPHRYCAALGMHYNSVTCGSVAGLTDRPHKADLVVDCAALRKTLAKVHARRAAATSA